MKLQLSAVIIALTINPLASASTAKYKQLLSMDLGEMLKVKVATGTMKELSEAPAVVSIISAQDIKETGATTLREALQRIPGLHVSETTDDRKLFTIRGLETSYTPQTLLLINGVEVMVPQTSAPMFAFTYPIEAVERIEVIRGPGSAVYGADAFSGVINVITKKAQANGYSIGGRVGSFDSHKAWANISYVNDDLAMALSVSRYVRKDDDNRKIDGKALGAEDELSQLHLNVNYGDFSFENWYQSNTHQYGTPLGIWVNDEDFVKSNQWHSKLSYFNHINERLSVDSHISYNQVNYQSYLTVFPAGSYGIGVDGNFDPFSTNEVNFPQGMLGNPGIDSDTIRFSNAFIYQLPLHRVRLAFGGTYMEMTSKETKNFGPGVLDVGNYKAISTKVVNVSDTAYVFLPNYLRKVWFVSVQDEWKFADNWELTTGIRYDHFSDFGSTTNPRVALVWKTTNELTTKLMFGSAFRAPSVQELTAQNNPVALGNKHLDAETIDTFELSFDYQPLEQLKLRANFYQYRANGLISLVPNPNLPGEIFAENAFDQQGEGAEFEANWQVSNDFSVDANIAWQQSENPDTRISTAMVPSTTAYLDLRYRIMPNLRLSMQSYWVAGQKRGFCDIGEPAFNDVGLDCLNTKPRAPIDDYALTDITALYQISSQWQASLNINNVFDKSYREPTASTPLFTLGFGYPEDIPMYGRAIQGTIEYSF